MRKILAGLLIGTGLAAVATSAALAGDRFDSTDRAPAPTQQIEVQTSYQMPQMAPADPDPAGPFVNLRDTNRDSGPR